jgi:hypothetical protein
MKDVYYVGLCKDGPKITGFAILAKTPALKPGQFKLINMTFLPDNLRHKDLLASFFTFEKNAQSLFVSLRPTNGKEIAIYKSLGFLENPKAALDPSHPIQPDRHTVYELRL